MMPKILWDDTIETRGAYCIEYEVIYIHPHQKKPLIFTALIHEIGHWLLFRLGDNHVVRTLNAKYDWVDYVITEGEIPRRTSTMTRTGRTRTTFQRT